LLAAVEWGLTREGATLAALLEERDVFDRGEMLGPRRGPRISGSANRSDLLFRLDLIERAAGDSEARSLGLDPRTAARVRRSRDQLLRVLGRVSESGRSGITAREDDLLKLPLMAYPDRVVRRRAPGSEFGLM